MGKVLIVDDSKLIRMRLRKFFEHSYDVVEAENGRDALVKIKLEQPDFVFTDLLMPEMDGFQLLERLRELNIGTPAVVLTADIQDETTTRCMELGAVCVLNKPPNEEQIRTAVLKAMQKGGF